MSRSRALAVAPSRLPCLPRQESVRHDPVPRRAYPGRPGPVRIGERAARTLVTELARLNDSKAALLAGATSQSAVLAAAIEALLPGDRLTVVPAEGGSAAALRDHVTAQGRWVADRVRVVDSSPRPTRPRW